MESISRDVLLNLSIFVFDFDGTLVDSAKMKHDAFYKVCLNDSHFNNELAKVLSEYPEASRYIVFEKVLKRLNRYNNLKEEVVRFASIYNSYVEKGAVSCKVFDQVEELLKFLVDTKRKVILSSNTPEVNLKRIISKRNWTNYFYEIHGSPKNKKETLFDILKHSGVSPQNTIVFGDGNSDHDSAKFNKTHYYNVNVQTIASFYKEIINV